MACNLILSPSGAIRATSFVPAAHYDVGDVNVYIPTAMTKHAQTFLYLKNEQGLCEIVELTRSGASGSNTLYKLSLDQPMRVSDEKVELKILLLNGTDGTYVLSNPFNIYLHTNNYVPARQVFLARQIGASMQELYIKVLALTEENRKLINELKERGHIE